MIIYSRQQVGQYHWREVGSITSAQTALGTDKSDETVNALSSTKTAVWQPKDGWVAQEFRFKGGTNNQTNTLNLYAQRKGTDDYKLIATLTIVTGQQTDGTDNYIDTITITNESWPDGGMERNNSTDSIATLAMNTYGYEKFLFIATILSSSEIKIDVTRI